MACYALKAREFCFFSDSARLACYRLGFQEGTNALPLLNVQGKN